MSQSRKMSLLESLVNVAVGYGIACLSQTLIFPLFGIQCHLKDTLLIGACFTVISIIRSYILRRAFNYYHHIQEERRHGTIRFR